MDNSGRREAPITFFFKLNFVLYKIYYRKVAPTERSTTLEKDF